MRVDVYTQAGKLVSATPKNTLYVGRYSVVLRDGATSVIKASSPTGTSNLCRWGVSSQQGSLESVCPEERICARLRRLPASAVSHVLVPEAHWNLFDTNFFRSTYMPHGALIDRLFIDDYNEAKLLRMAKEITTGVCQLHNANVVHRNLKPDNVLLDKNDTCYICDMDMADDADACSIFTGCAGPGTPKYAAPEMFKHNCKSTPFHYDGKKADVWSLAVTIIAMFTLNVPFLEARDVCVEFYNWRVYGIVPSCFKALPCDLKHITLDMLRVNPAERPDATEVLEKLNALPIGPDKEKHEEQK